MRSDKTTDHAIQEYLETISKKKNRIWVQFEARSRERLAILPNTVTCSRSLQHCLQRALRKRENHKNKNSLIQDLKQTEKINKFSKESQDLIADMNNTEIFELCEDPSKQQCTDCNAYWEMGIIYCSCGRNMNSTRSPTEFDLNNRDVTSIPGYVVKKNRSRGAKHGPSERQKMYYQAKQMLKKIPSVKARMPSNDTFTMVCRRSLQKVIVAHRMERAPHNVVPQNRRGEAHLHRYKS